MKSKPPTLLPRWKHSSRVPAGLCSMQIPHELNEKLQQECIEIFTLMSNAGKPFQDSLVAIYLSGMNAAQEALRAPT